MNPVFFTLHCCLPREGPGDADSLKKNASVAGIAFDVPALDTGCGPGADPVRTGLLDRAEAGIALSGTCRRQSGYPRSVERPV